MPKTNKPALTASKLDQNRAVEKTAVRLQALAEPTRLKIVKLLFKGPQNVTAIATHVGVEIVNTSHHLGVLKLSGLVTQRKDGRFVIYELNPDVIGPDSSGDPTVFCGDGVKVVFNG